MNTRFSHSDRTLLVAFSNNHNKKISLPFLLELQMNMFTSEIYPINRKNVSFPAPVQPLYKPPPQLKKATFNFKVENLEKSGKFFDGEVEAKRLYYRLHGLSTESIVDILGNMRQYHRSRIVHFYYHLFKRKLSADLRDVLGGDFEQSCQSLIAEPKVFLAKEIHKILSEFPYPREEELISILCERSNEEVQAIQEAYQTKFGISLEKSLKNKLEMEGEKFIRILVNPLRQEDWTLSSLQSHLDAQNLLNLGIGVAYGDSPAPVIYSLLRKRGYGHIRNVFNEYHRIRRKQIWQSLEIKMPTSQRQRLIAIMEAVNNPSLYAAKVLHKSTTRFGEFSQCLLRIRLSRSREFYKSVEETYAELYNTRIRDLINRETIGENRNILQTLIEF